MSGSRGVPWALRERDGGRGLVSGAGIGDNRTVQVRRVIGYQFDLAWEDASRNEATVEAWLESRRPEPGALVVLPEMFSSGFSLNTAVVAQPAQGATERRLSGLARRHGIWLVGGLAVRRPEGSTNEAVVWGPEGAEVVRYRKQRPVSSPPCSPPLSLDVAAAARNSESRHDPRPPRRQPVQRERAPRRARPRRARPRRARRLTRPRHPCLAQARSRSAPRSRAATSASAPRPPPRCPWA